MKKLILCLSIVWGTLAVYAQEKENPVVLEIGNKKVTLEEFEAIYKKNADENKTSTPEELKDYLDLYIKFKLKVVEAEALGMDTLPAFVQELEGYRKQLAQPYLSDREVTEGLIKEAYERMKSDVNASHILVKVSQEAEPKDTLAAYNKILKIRKRIINGEDFEKVAAETSEDPSAVKNKGNLGYFTVFQMVYPFESAAYNTEVGKISMPVRTSFGYHILKVNDKRPARGTMKAAHIMIRVNKNDGEEEIQNKKQKIDEILTKIKEGGDFFSLARQYSEDKESAKRGGELPPFGSGRMVEEFENAAFALENDGDISAPVLTDFGWHIIKRIELKPIGDFEEVYPTLKSKVARDSRSNKSQEIVINNMKKENNFKEYPKALQDFYKLDLKKIKGKEWKAEDVKKLDKTLFGFYPTDGEKFEYNQKAFAKRLENHLKRNEPTDNFELKPYINKLYNTVVEEMTLRFKNLRLPKVNPEFRMLLQEYRDGILLFNITDEKVWGKAIKDSVGLEAFYQANKNKYMWDERVDVTIYKCTNDKVAKKVQKLIKAKAKKGYTDEDITKKINVKSQLDLTIENGIFTKEQNELVAMAKWEKGVTSKVTTENEVVLVEVNEVLPPQPKALDEIRGLVTSDYQNQLEKEWLEALKKKYPVKIHEDVLSKIK